MSGGAARAAREQDPRFGEGREAVVLVVSTSAAAGEAADTTGPVLVEWLRGRGYACAGPVVVADGEPVGRALRAALTPGDGADVPRVVVTTGGTGLNPDDRTPEQTADLIERPTPGILHALWSRGLESTPTAVMSRGLAGVRGRTFLVNLPGSRGGVKDGIAVLDGLLPHIQAQIEDERDHGGTR